MPVNSPELPKSDIPDEGDLVRRVRPPDWRNPQPAQVYDLAIVGGGPAGLAAADCAIRLGLRVALVERHRLGGNSLNSGSIPSKTIIRTARVCATVHRAGQFGAAPSPELPAEFPEVMARMRRIRARIAEYHSADRLEAMGVDVFFGAAQFVGPGALVAGDTPLAFKKALIATGSRPRRPAIPGLEEVGYLTSASIFDLATLPRRLIVIGGGPLGCELAQAFSRLGSRVTIVQDEPKFLPHEERDASQLLSYALARDGVDTRLNSRITSIREDKGAKMLEATSDDAKFSVAAEEILLSVGGVPDLEALGLEAAGVRFDTGRGIEVDDFLRTTNRRILAAGDVCLPYKFTNVAEASARMAVHNAFGGPRARVSHMTIPWCTYCDPEIAHVGVHVWDSGQGSKPIKSFTVMMQDVDRAITDGQDDGFVKIHVKTGTDRIIGATIVASRASEMINEISVAMSTGIGMRDLAEVLHSYPAQSDGIRQAALAYMRDRPVSWWRRAYAKFRA